MDEILKIDDRLGLSSGKVTIIEKKKIEFMIYKKNGKWILNLGFPMLYKLEEIEQFYPLDKDFILHSGLGYTVPKEEINQIIKKWKEYVKSKT